MKKNHIINKTILINSLTDLSDKNYQQAVWIDGNTKPRHTLFFLDAALNFMEDTLLDLAFENDEIIFDKYITSLLKEVYDTVDAIDENRDNEDIINDPLMDIVRQKSSEALRLIAASDGVESTVDFIEP